MFDPSFADRARQLQEKCPGLKRLLSFGPCDVGEDLLALASTFSPQPLVAPDVQAEDVAGLAYTGGTTGKPKGVMGTYRSGATMTMIQMAEWEWPEDTRFLICTPLSHAGAAFFIPTLLTGGAIVVLPHFEPGLFLETIEKYEITATMLVPTMLYVLLDHPKLDATDVSSLQTVYYGAAACSPTRLQEAINRLGPIFFQYYGQAECPMAITSLKKEDHDVNDMARLATCGRPTPWVKVRLLDDDCNEVKRGEPGEICVQGPLVMAGYWKKPAETEEALKGGWLHTGDIAREDEHGFYTIVDRKKDMIVSGGFNVFPREIEDVLAHHPSVSQCAVIGVPDEKWGEAVKAIVVLRPGAERRARGAHGAGQRAQGRAPHAEVDRVRRCDPVEPARQARQEGVAGAVLGFDRSAGSLSAHRLHHRIGGRHRRGDAGPAGEGRRARHRRRRARRRGRRRPLDARGTRRDGHRGARRVRWRARRPRRGRGHHGRQAARRRHQLLRCDRNAGRAAAAARARAPTRPRWRSAPTRRRRRRACPRRSST